MGFEGIGHKMVEISVDGKQYALVPLCTFHDVKGSGSDQALLDQFGLRDAYSTFTCYEIVDPKKVMMAKIKYGI